MQFEFDHSLLLVMLALCIVASDDALFFFLAGDADWFSFLCGGGAEEACSEAVVFMCLSNCIVVAICWD